MTSIVATDADLVVDVRGVSRSFGSQHVLDGLDLAVRRGEFVALIGQSGTGKSTLLRVLSGFDNDFGGEAEVARRRALVFQDPRLLPWARVLPNVTLGLRGSAAKARGRAALDEVGLADKERQWPVNLSGGEAQRVGLARALVREPELLLLDEPFAALDALTKIRMQALLRRLCARHRPGVILVTHDVDEAITLADRVLVLVDGKVSLDARVDPSWRESRTAAEFAELRTRLLNELGVNEQIPANGPDGPASFEEG